MPSTRTDRRLRATLCALALALAAAALAFPAPAAAVSVWVKPFCGVTPQIHVRTAATDTVGIGMVFVDGVAVDSVALKPSSVATLTAPALQPGLHTVSVALRTSDGIRTSAGTVMRAWAPPAAPKLLTPVPPGLCPDEVTLEVLVPEGATRFTALSAGRTLMEQEVENAPARLLVTLPVGEDATKVELRAENPLYATSAYVDLCRAAWPLPGYDTLSSHFGPRWGRMHEGIDVPAPTGTDAVAAAKGVVVYAGPRGGYGNCVEIDHGSGYHTRYGHFSRIRVEVGQVVERGEHIADVGSTGNSTGPHLHFEVRIDGVAYDPLDFL